MLLQFLSVGLIMLVSVMLPGPDFALVTKNTVIHARRAGVMTSLGISSAVLVHMTYCILGLAVVIANSLILFTAIKYIGASYLVYIGVSILLSKSKTVSTDSVENNQSRQGNLSDAAAYWQGFLCNLLNPKATLFFLALFTLIIKPDTPVWVQILYGLQMSALALVWFILMSYTFSHRWVIGSLKRIESYIEKTLGILLIGFGVALAFVKH